MNDDVSQKPQRKRAGAKAASQSSDSVVDAPTTPPKPPKPDKFGSGYDYLLVNEDMRENTFPEVMGCVNHFRKHDKVVLILVTYGGSANAAYRTARFLQTVYDDVVAFLPAECKSAGTLLVTAANSVIISPFGEIGPLDVQLLKRDELAGRRSGLTTRSALEDLKTHSFDLFEHFMTEIIKKSGTAVSFRTAADVAARVTSRLLSRIYEQINPDALGQDYRDLSIALRYGERLNRKFSNLKKDALTQLVYEYPSHDFVIDLEEAKELFQRVELPTPALMRLVSSRAVDCLIPKYGSDRLVAMLSSDGQIITLEKPDAPQRNRANATASPTSPVQTGGNGAGTTAAS
jgi:hypothetical protein